MSKKINCDSVTLADLKKHKNYKSIEGRSKMNKAELCKAINKTITKSHKKDGALKKIKSKKDSKVSPKKVSPSKVSPKKVSPKKASPKKSILTYLPTEMHEKILLETDPGTLIDACNTNKEALKLCTTDEFWKKYYTMRGVKFIPKSYDYGSRIKKVRKELMLAMNIDELHAECKRDKQSQKICDPLYGNNKFWPEYYKTHGKLYISESMPLEKRIKHFKIMSSFKNNEINGVITKIKQLEDVLSRNLFARQREMLNSFFQKLRAKGKVDVTITLTIGSDDPIKFEFFVNGKLMYNSKNEYQLVDIYNLLD